jgi:digeranylgeranylglycerophospholipid reductase
MAKKYDVIVVGAGPAGFLAAKAAGENGLDVALLERKSDPTRLTRACGQSLVCFNEYWLGNITRYNTRDKRICFPSDGFSFEYDGPYENIYSTRMYTPKGHKVDFGDYEQQKSWGDYGRVGLAFDKEIMFRYLLEKVKACGVDVFPGINVEKVASTADGVTVEGSGQSFEGSYVIAADGGNSRIAQVMGFNKDRTHYCTLNCIGYYMSGLDLPVPHDMVVRISTPMTGNDAWFFVIPRPTEGEYNILILNLNPRVNLVAAGDYFMNEAFCAPWFKKARKLKALSAVLSWYSPIVEAYRDRVLIAGDVGAQLELENQGAMISGWRAGQAISTAVQEKNLGLETTGISQYVNWWKEAYANFYAFENGMRAFALSLILTKEDMEYFYGYIKETMPALWAPSGTEQGKAVGQATAKATSNIERDRPDIFQKLQRSRSTPSTELMAEVTKISKPVVGTVDGSLHPSI